MPSLSSGAGRVFAEEQDYTVQSADTLFSIPGTFEIVIGRLIVANEIEDPNVIGAGDVIHIPDPADPAAAYYTIVAGDWLSRIARDFGSSVDALVAANAVADKDLIQPEVRIAIPVGDGTGEVAADDGLAGADAFCYVEAGDTLGRIAAEFDTSIEAIVRANEIADLNLIFPGQRLTLLSG